MTTPVTDRVPVLEIGGTHVTAALVDRPGGRVVPGTRRRCPLWPDAPADEILASILTCADGLAGAHWGVALPGPFDYERGIALYEGVGKFDSLYGVNVGRALRAGLAGQGTRVTFLNDADAFLLGELETGAAAGHDRAIGVTLGSGVGSAFIAHRTFVDAGPDVPPGGRADLLFVDGRPLEDVVSRRALIRAYAATSRRPGAEADVQEIAARARAGDPKAQAVLDRAFVVLGEALGPWVERFRATVLVVGGAMTGSWDLIGRPLRQGLSVINPELASSCDVTLPRHNEDAALLGAAARAAED